MSDRVPLRLLQAVVNAAWALDEGYLRTMLDVVEREGEGVEALETRLGRPLDNTRTITVRDGVAVVPVNGAMVSRAGLFSQVSGLQSYGQLATELQTAMDDPKVRAIVLAMGDAPGGEVTGVNSLAAHVRRWSAHKPIIAHVEGMAASAAYWLASAATSIVMAPNAEVGSLGVVYVRTEAADRPGVRRHQIVSSQSPFKRLDLSSPDGASAMQARVDAQAEIFIEAVAAHRGASVDHVLASFGQGNMVIAKAAIAAGMADQLGLLEDVIADQAKTPTRLRLVPPSKGNAAMDWQAIDAAQLRANRPDLVEAIAADTRAACDTAHQAQIAAVRAEAETAAAAAATTARTEAAAGERERIGKITELALPGQGKLAGDLIASGATVPDAAVALLGDARRAPTAALEALASATPTVLPTEPGREPARPAATGQEAAEQLRGEIRAAAEKGETIDAAEASRRLRRRQAA